MKGRSFRLWLGSGAVLNWSTKEGKMPSGKQNVKENLKKSNKEKRNELVSREKYQKKEESL